jgi:hypothetical protein
MSISWLRNCSPLDHQDQGLFFHCYYFLSVIRSSTRNHGSHREGSGLHDERTMKHRPILREQGQGNQASDRHQIDPCSGLHVRHLPHGSKERGQCPHCRHAPGSRSAPGIPILHYHAYLLCVLWPVPTANDSSMSEDWA